jgi:transcriptional regulator with XRE-family HTH domain
MGKRAATTAASEVAGERIRQARKESGLSQTALGQALADYFGAPWLRPTVAQMEVGRRSFTAAELLAIAHLLDRPLTWFFTPAHSVTEIAVSRSRSLPVEEVLRALRTEIGTDEVRARLQEAITEANRALIILSPAAARGEALAPTVETTSRPSGDERQPQRRKNESSSSPARKSRSKPAKRR